MHEAQHQDALQVGRGALAGGHLAFEWAACVGAGTSSRIAAGGLQQLPKPIRRPVWKMLVFRRRKGFPLHRKLPRAPLATVAALTFDSKT